MSIFGADGTIGHIDGSLVLGEDAGCCCGDLALVATPCVLDCPETRIIDGPGLAPGSVFEAEGRCWNVNNATPPEGAAEITPGTTHGGCDACLQPPGCVCWGDEVTWDCPGAPTLSCYICIPPGADDTAESVYRRTEVVTQYEQRRPTSTRCGCGVIDPGYARRRVRIISETRGRRVFMESEQWSSAAVSFLTGVDGGCRTIENGGGDESQAAFPRDTLVSCRSRATSLGTGRGFRAEGCIDNSRPIEGITGERNGWIEDRRLVANSCSRGDITFIEDSDFVVVAVGGVCAGVALRLQRREVIAEIHANRCEFGGCPDEPSGETGTVPCATIAVSCDGTKRIAIDFDELIADAAEAFGTWSGTGLLAERGGVLYRPTLTMVSEPSVPVRPVIDAVCGDGIQRGLSQCAREGDENYCRDCPSVVVIEDAVLEHALGSAHGEGWSDGSVVALDIDGRTVCYRVGGVFNNTVPDGYEVLGLVDQCDPCEVAGGDGGGGGGGAGADAGDALPSDVLR